jgi:hypothetical protein
MEKAARVRLTAFVVAGGRNGRHIPLYFGAA